MSELVRWRPFREMSRMQDMMDRLFEDAVFRPWGWRRAEGFGMIPVDIYETSDEYTIKAPMPGVTADKMEVTYEAGVLTVQGEVSEEKAAQGECLVQERRYGKFSRSIGLPGTIQPEKIVAGLRDGVLTLRVPKAEEVKPKRISVKVE